QRSHAKLGGLILPAFYAAPLLLLLILPPLLHKHVSWGDLMRAAPSSVIMGILALVVVAATAVFQLRRKAELDLHRPCVRVTVNGAAKVYPGRDIADAMLLTDKANLNCVRILRKGEFTDSPSPALIQPEFDLPPSQLLAIIRAGISQWGSADGA